MKFLFALVTTLLLSSAYAESGCGGIYAAGLGHVFKSKGVDFANQELISEGDSAHDEFYSATVKRVKGELKVELTDVKSNRKVVLQTVIPFPGAKVYTTANLKGTGKHPSGVPGAFEGLYLMFVCTE